VVSSNGSFAIGGPMRRFEIKIRLPSRSIRSARTSSIPGPAYLRTDKTIDRGREVTSEWASAFETDMKKRWRYAVFCTATNF